MDGGAWWAAVHGVAESRTRLSNFTFTFHFHVLEKEMATHSSVLVWRIPGTAEPVGGTAYTVMGLSDKEYACNAGHAGNMHLISGSIGSPGIGNGTPLQYSCLGNPMNIGGIQSKESQTVTEKAYRSSVVRRVEVVCCR